MSATEPDRVAVTLELAPLPAEALTPGVQKLLGGPAQAKLMAARGMALMRPAELLTAVYQLSFDAEAAVKAAAAAGAAALPDKIVAPALGEGLPPQVLHFFAGHLAPTRSEALERLLLNQAAPDATFVLLGGRLLERELEVILQNEARILRCPAILEALYRNPQARMSSLNRVLELCARNGVRVEGIPSFDEVVRSISDDPGSTDPAFADASFAQALAATEAAPPEAAAAVEDEEGPGATDAGAKDTKRKSPVIDFTRLKLHEKIRLATLGNAYCRKNLIRDPNRMVAMAVVRSPRITEGELADAASSRNVCEEVIRYIASQRDLIKLYPVKHSLVQNPKCPIAISLRLMPLLHPEDLRTLARSKNVPSALTAAARRLVASRKGGEGGSH